MIIWKRGHNNKIENDCGMHKKNGQRKIRAKCRVLIGFPHSSSSRLGPSRHFFRACAFSRSLFVAPMNLRDEKLTNPCRAFLHYIPHVTLSKPDTQDI